MSDENKNGGSGNDKKDAGLTCCIEPIFVTFIIFACVTVILTWLFCLPVKRIIEQFSNEHCVHTFVLMIIYGSRIIEFVKETFTFIINMY